MAEKTQIKTVNGLRCKAKSFKRTVPGIYKDIGAKLRVKESRREIRRTTIDVYLQNRYYLKDEFAPGASAQLVEFVPPFLGSRVTFKKWRHRHFAVGLGGIKLELESVFTPAGGSPTGGIIGLMPLVGVLSEVAVKVERDGKVRHEMFITQRGSVPDNITQRVLIPRIGAIPPISVKNTLVQGVGLSLPISIRQTFESGGVYLNQPIKSLRGGLFMLR